MTQSQGVIHPRYLPYTADELALHMPPVAARREETAASWISHFTTSALLDLDFHGTTPNPRGVPVSAVRKARQVDKDERFWIAASMMRLVRTREPRETLQRLLADAFAPGQLVDGAPWTELLDGEVHLFFEAKLPSPRSYRDALGGRIDKHPVAYVRDAAISRTTDTIRTGLEGPTNVDALLVARETGFGLVIEAKVLSDVSHDVTFDPIRNQIARNLDVMLEPNDSLPYPLSARRPERTVFLLVTPQLFVDHPTSRLYGWLMNEYRSDPSALARDLAHRSPAELAGLEHRIGWASWERIAAIEPDACPWLRW